jgi:hypothetical protein
MAFCGRSNDLLKAGNLWGATAVLRRMRNWEPLRSGSLKLFNQRNLVKVLFKLLQLVKDKSPNHPEMEEIDSLLAKKTKKFENPEDTLDILEATIKIATLAV